MRHGAARLALRSGLAAAPLTFIPARPAALRPILWMKSSRHAQAHSHQTLIAFLHDNAATTGATPRPVALFEIVHNARGRVCGASVRAKSIRSGGSAGGGFRLKAFRSCSIAPSDLRRDRELYRV
jgi:hypothetical protein